MAYLSKYGVARKIRIPMVKRGVVDHAVSADWTPAAGDVKISKDGGAAANVTNLPTAIAMGNSTIWEFSLTATEMQAAQINVTVGDSATKAVEDTAFDLETYGNASAQHAVDLSDGVRAGLTALPNAAAEAAGGLYTRGSGAGQVNQNANGQLDARVVGYSAGQDGATRRGTAQAGAAGSITLDAGASAVDSFYNWQVVFILSGTGAGQARAVTGYTGATKVATVAPNWATNPDNTSVFAIEPMGRANVGAWLDTAVPAPGTAGVPNVDLTRIDNQATNGNNATLNLKQLNVVNNAGDAIVASSTGSNGNGINTSGNGTGAGVIATGGATGDGAKFAGGATSGNGIRAVAVGGGHGMLLTGVGTGHGLSANGGNSNGNGINASGGLGGVPISGNITGNITGNLSGSVGSVTGAVGSVTGNVGGNVNGNVAGSVGNLAAGAQGDVRTAVGMASANLDTQLSNIYARIGAPVGASISADIAAIYARTDVATSTRSAFNPATDVVEGTVTWTQAARLWNAAMGGKASGLDTTTATYRDLGDTKDRLVATVDANGNRTAVVRDLS